MQTDRKKRTEIGRQAEADRQRDRDRQTGRQTRGEIEEKLREKRFGGGKVT